MTEGRQKIIYTLTDEAPRLATEAFLPVVSTFADAAGIDVTTSDISLAARILAAFPDRLTDEQKVADNLGELGRLTHEPDTNIIKLPNISASVPQINTAVAELQAQGYDIPEYPYDPKTEEEVEIAERFAGVLGSAVNPVLRQGNSDRRAPKAVKEYAKANPHSMGKWSMASQTHVAHMTHGDFYAGEKSIILDRDCDVRMEVQTPEGETQVLKTESLLKGTVVDSMFMSKKALLEFYEEQLNDAKETGVMFSLHVKATMMRSATRSCSDTPSGSSTRRPSPSTRNCSPSWGSTSTTAWLISTRRSRHSRVPRRRRSSKISTGATSTARSWRWWTPPAGSPTSTPLRM